MIYKIVGMTFTQNGCSFVLKTSLFGVVGHMNFNYFSTNKIKLDAIEIINPIRLPF